MTKTRFYICGTINNVTNITFKVMAFNLSDAIQLVTTMGLHTITNVVEGNRLKRCTMIRHSEIFQSNVSPVANFFR
jgi:hypothetical protein